MADLQRSYLGEAAQRLINALGVDGLVDPRYKAGEAILPVILVADATGPGMGSRRGRKWSAGLVQAGGGATQSLALRANADVVVERIQIVTTSAAGTEWRLFYLGPADADPILIATQNVLFLDRAQTGVEFAPLLTGAVTPQVIPATGSIWRTTSSTNQLQEVRITPFMMVAGSKLLFSQSGIADSRVNFFGRMF